MTLQIIILIILIVLYKLKKINPYHQIIIVNTYTHIISHLPTGFPQCDDITTKSVKVLS